MLFAFKVGFIIRSGLGFLLALGLRFRAGVVASRLLTIGVAISFQPRPTPDTT